MHEMENLNRQTQAMVLQLGQQIQQVASGCAESVGQLAGATRAAFEVVRAEHESDFEKIAQQIEKSTSETDQCFSKLEIDLVQVVNEIGELCGAIDSAICSESGQRTRAEQKVFEGFQSFTSAVAGQLAAHMKSMTQMQGNVRSHVESICGSFFLSWKEEISTFLRDMTNSVGDTQARTTAVEQKLSDYIVSVGKRQDEIMALIDSKLVIKAPDPDLVTRVTKLEDALATRETPTQVTRPHPVPFHPLFRPPQFPDLSRGRIPTTPPFNISLIGTSDLPPDSGLGPTTDAQPENELEDLEEPAPVPEAPIEDDDVDAREPDADPIEPRPRRRTDTIPRGPRKRLARRTRTQAPDELPPVPDGETAMPTWDLLGDVEPSLQPCEFADDVIVPPGDTSSKSANPRGRRRK
jgi:hypothetical protein